MSQEPPQKPTASELEILRVLWTRGPSTVREVYEALCEQKSLGYTTVLKLLQIMTAKGTVRRNEEAARGRRATPGFRGLRERIDDSCAGGPANVQERTGRAAPPAG